MAEQMLSRAKLSLICSGGASSTAFRISLSTSDSWTHLRQSSRGWQEHEHSALPPVFSGAHAML
jgi:hypothetical protein